MCKQCGDKTDLTPHCTGFTCDWVVCELCGATSNVRSDNPEAYFTRKPRDRKAG